VNVHVLTGTLDSLVGEAPEERAALWAVGWFSSWPDLKLVVVRFRGWV